MNNIWGYAAANGMAVDEKGFRARYPKEGEAAM